MPNVETRFEAVLVDGMQTAARSTSYLSIPDSNGLYQIVAGSQVWAQALDGVTDGAITELAIELVVPLPTGIKGPTGATWEASRAAQTGVISFSATGSDRRWGFAIPSLSSATLSGGKVDLTNAAIVALVDLLLNPTDLFTNPQQQVLEAALDALLSFRQRALYLKRHLGIQYPDA